MQTQRQVDECTLEALKQARSKDLASDIARRASISALEARLASTQPESAGPVLQGDMSADDVARMARQVGYPISHPEWRKATEEFAALLAAAILRASPAEPKAPAAEPEWGPYRAIEAIRAAGVRVQEPEQEPEFWGRVAARQASRIKQLATTGQQALEALEKYQRMMLVEAGCQSEEGEAAIDNLRAVLAQPVPVVSPEVQVRAIASEIIDALNADEQDGGYDLTAGLFGARFSALVRRWAALESVETQRWQQLISMRTAISEIAQGCERRLRKGRDAGDEDTLRICRQAMEDLGKPAAEPPKPLSASDIESAIGYRLPQHSMELLLGLIQEREEVMRGLHAENGRPRGIVPAVPEERNDELSDENEQKERPHGS